MSDLAELETAIAGIERMTAELEELRRVRADYVRAFGARGARATFAELDRALKRLRKAAR